MIPLFGSQKRLCDGFSRRDLLHIGGDVEHAPVSPKDILATAFYLLGVSPDTLIYDQLNRPLPIAGTGVIRPELF